MDKDKLIEQTKVFVKEKLYGEGSGHDWYHIERVHKLAKFLAKEEKADTFIVEMTALLHDIDDWKFSKTNNAEMAVTKTFLKEINLDEKLSKKIIEIIKTMSFKGGVVSSKQTSIEGMVVQDADRLDAIGAIGIARAFAYGGHKGNMIYNPKLEPQNFKNLEEVKNKENHTINHFYEKLLKLKDLINTDAAKKIAEKRHNYMLNFLEEFYQEWNFE